MRGEWQRRAGDLRFCGVRRPTLERSPLLCPGDAAAAMFCTWMLGVCGFKDEVSNNTTHQHYGPHHRTSPKPPPPPHHHQYITYALYSPASVAPERCTPRPRRRNAAHLATNCGTPAPLASRRWISWCGGGGGDGGGGGGIDLFY
jgi:hypothetical protein